MNNLENILNNLYFRKYNHFIINLKLIYNIFYNILLIIL